MSQNAQTLTRWAKHSSVTDTTATPGTLAFLEPTSDSDGIMPKQGKVPRDLIRGDAERYSDRVGAKSVSVGLTLEVTGTSPADGTAVNASNDTEIGDLLDLFLGQTANNDGHASTPAVLGSGSTGTTVELGSGDGADFTAGNAVLAPMGASNINEAREIVSKSTDTLTVDRNIGGTPSSGGTVYPSATWYLNPRTLNPTHAYFTEEHEAGDGSAESRFDAFGCAPARLRFNFPNNGGLITAAMSFEGSDWDDTVAVDDPTFSAPTKGSPIPFVDSPLFVGNNELCVRNLSLEIVCELVPRECSGGPNGFKGYLITNRTATLSGEFYVGDLSGEVPIGSGTPDLGDLQGNSTQDVAIQFGRDPGACMYIRMPAADFTANFAKGNGLQTVSFTATASRSGNHSTVPGALRLHLF